MTAPAAPTRLPRWGFQEHLVQRDKAAFWVFAALLALGGLNFAREQLAYADIDPVGLVLSWVLMVAYIVPVVLVLSRLDLYEREPLSLMVGAFLWGAWVATAFAAPVNGQVDAFLHSQLGGDVYFPWTNAITAPLVEETYKYLGLVALFLIASNEFDDLMDGFIYGALIGLGFTVSEDVFYFMTQFGGTVPDVIAGFLVRVVASGLYTHVLFTGLAGIGFAYFVSRRGDVPALAASRGRRWDARARDDRALRLELAARGGWQRPRRLAALRRRQGPAVPAAPRGRRSAGEAPRASLALRRARLRAGGRRRHGRGPGSPDRSGRGERDPPAVLASRGAPGMRLLKDLRRELINLAMVRTRVEGEDDPDLLRQRSVLVDLRKRLDGLALIASTPAAQPAASKASAAAAPVVGPPAPEPAPPQAAWTSDLQVPPDGMTAWPVPDGTSPGAVRLAPGLPLRRRSQAGDWTQVEASNGWRGWVDGRGLVTPPGAPPTNRPG